MFSKIRRLIRLIRRLLHRFRAEFKQFRLSIREVFNYLIDRLVNHIVLKYHCLQVRKRMC